MISGSQKGELKKKNVKFRNPAKEAEKVWKWKISIKVGKFAMQPD